MFQDTDYDSQRWRAKIIGKAIAFSAIAFLIGYILVYILMEHILKVKEYGLNEVLIATGIPLLFWLIAIAISLIPLYRYDKERFERIDKDEKGKLLKVKKQVNFLIMILVFLAFLNMSTLFVSVPFLFQIFLYLLITIVLILILILVMKSLMEKKK